MPNHHRIGDLRERDIGGATAFLLQPEFSYVGDNPYDFAERLRRLGISVVEPDALAKRVAIQARIGAPWFHRSASLVERRHRRQP